MFTPQGPSLRELCVQALSSVERGYDRLAPKFDHTPFRTPPHVLDATAAVLAGTGPYAAGLDVCCGTGAGLAVLERLCGRRTGVDLSAGMLERARAADPGATLVRADARELPFTGEFDLAVTFGALGHFLPSQLRRVFRGVHRALRPGGTFAVPVQEPAPMDTAEHWTGLGFDLTMLARNTLVRPPFVMYYHTSTPVTVRRDLVAAGFDVLSAPLTDRSRLLLARRPVSRAATTGR